MGRKTARIASLQKPPIYEYQQRANCAAEKKNCMKKNTGAKKFIEFEIRETSESKTAAAHFMSMRCNDSVGD